MSRKLVWIEQQRFRGWGCSECASVFNPSSAPAGKTFDEVMRSFELQRDKEFTLHVCLLCQTKTTSPSPANA
jgi:hypothetical protein